MGEVRVCSHCSKPPETRRLQTTQNLFRPRFWSLRDPNSGVHKVGSFWRLWGSLSRASLVVSGGTSDPLGSSAHKRDPPSSAPASRRCFPCASVSLGPKLPLLIRTPDIRGLGSALTQDNLILGKICKDRVSAEDRIHRFWEDRREGFIHSFNTHSALLGAPLNSGQWNPVSGKGSKIQRLLPFLTVLLPLTGVGAHLPCHAPSW